MTNEIKVGNIVRASEDAPKMTEADKKPNVGSITIPVEVDLSDSYWDAYAADLAKDIAVKLADNTYFINEKEKAAYVVKYAREIVENLKK